MSTPRQQRQDVNIILALLLVHTVVEISGIFDLMRG